MGSTEVEVLLQGYFPQQRVKEHKEAPLTGEPQSVSHDHISKSWLVEGKAVHKVHVYSPLRTAGDFRGQRLTIIWK